MFIIRDVKGDVKAEGYLVSAKKFLEILKRDRHEYTPQVFFCLSINSKRNAEDLAELARAAENTKRFVTKFEIVTPYQGYRYSPDEAKAITDLVKNLNQRIQKQKRLQQVHSRFYRHGALKVYPYSDDMSDCPLLRHSLDSYEFEMIRPAIKISSDISAERKTAKRRKKKKKNKQNEEKKSTLKP